MSKDETGPLVPRNRLAMNAGRRPRADAASEARARRSNATLLRTSSSVEANSTVGMDVGVDVGVKDAETTRGDGGDGGDSGDGVRPDEVETNGVGLASRASADQENETDGGEREDDAVSSSESVRAANATSGTNVASASARTRRRWRTVTTTRVMVWRDETSFFVSPRMFRVRVRALVCVVLVACATTTSGALARGEGDGDEKWRPGHARSLKQFLAPVRYSAVGYRDALYELGQALVDLALVRRQFEWVDLINDKHESGDYAYAEDSNADSYAYADYDK